MTFNPGDMEILLVGNPNPSACVCPSVWSLCCQVGIHLDIALTVIAQGTNSFLGLTGIHRSPFSRRLKVESHLGPL